MILVICISIDNCTKDGFGRLEWSVFNGRCSLYFLHCILSSFCRRLRKEDCLVKLFIAKLGVRCVLVFYTSDNTLCQWSISHSSQSRSGSCSYKLSNSLDTHNRKLSCLSCSKIPVDFNTLVYKTTHNHKIANKLICLVPCCLRRVKLCFRCGSCRNLQFSVCMVQRIQANSRIQ